MFSKLVKTYVRLKQKNKYLETMLNPKGRKPKENKTTMIWKLCSILKANNPPNHCFFCFLPLGLSIVSRSLFFCVNGIPRAPPNQRAPIYACMHVCMYVFMHNINIKFKSVYSSHFHHHASCCSHPSIPLVSNSYTTFHHLQCWRPPIESSVKFLASSGSGL